MTRRGRSGSISNEMADLLLGDLYESGEAIRGDHGQIKPGGINEVALPKIECTSLPHVHEVVCEGGDIALVNGDGIWTAHACSICGCKCRGIEPLWSMKEAANLIPFKNVVALKEWLWRHRKQFPSLKRKYGRHVPMRLLTSSEILRIRAMLIYKGKTRDPLMKAIVASERPAGGGTPRVIFEEVEE